MRLKILIAKIKTNLGIIPRFSLIYEKNISSIMPKKSVLKSLK